MGKRQRTKPPRRNIFKLLGRAILYLSDVFVILMVLTWGVYILSSLPAAWVELWRYGTATIFTDLKDACTLPLSVGGALWLIRVCLTHHSAHVHGKRLTPDFPNVDAPIGTIDDTVFTTDTGGTMPS